MSLVAFWWKCDGCVMSRRLGRDGERPLHDGRCHVAVVAVDARGERDRPCLRLARVEYRARLDALEVEAAGA